MSIVQVRRHSDTLTPEPDAPIPMARHGLTRRSATYHPAAITADQDEVLRCELEQLFAERLDDASGIEISVVEGCAALQGSVSCDLVRILAEDLVFAIPEIRECHNDLAVRNTRDGSSLAA
jgi:hypothetical protein